METETEKLNNLPKTAQPVRHEDRVKTGRSQGNCAKEGKSQSQNGYILSDSIYIIFLK